MLWFVAGCITPQAEYLDIVEGVIDPDGDGFYDEAEWAGEPYLDQLELLPGDCDEGDAEVNPAADEACDGVDNDCDEDIDEGLAELDGWFVDGDGDGFGDPEDPVLACPFPPGAIEDDSDCDDTDGEVFPGADEVCNSEDEDCDGAVDEGVTSAWYEDTDDDGYGAGDPLDACDPGAGWSLESGDCAADDPTIHPGQTETCNDGLDNDCDPDTDCRWKGDVALEEMQIAYGESEGGNFGSILALGDVDGADADDILVGAPDHEGVGAAYLFKDGNAPSASDAYASFEGGTANGGFGIGLDFYDLDGDGRDEVLVGADNTDGSVYVFGRPWGTTNAAASADAAYTPSGSSGRFGHSVAGVDLDGSGGLVVGAITKGSSGGAVFLFPHEGDGDWAPQADALIYGTAPGQDLGEDVAAEDTDGDGIAEIWASAPHVSDEVADGGAVYVFEQPVAASVVLDADRVVRGVVEGQQLEGLDFADVDGDGRLDALLGAPAVGYADPGALYVFTALSGDHATDEADLRVDGSVAYGSFGFRGAWLDLDDSGQGDLAIAAPGEGAVHVFYEVVDSGVLVGTDSDARLQLNGSQKLDLVSSSAWSPPGDSLVMGCLKCQDGGSQPGAILWVASVGP